MTYIGATTNQSPNTVSSLTANTPASVLPGDRILVMCAAPTNVTWTTPAGYAVLAPSPRVRGTVISGVVYEKTAGSADANVPVTVTPSSNTRLAMIIRVYRDVDVFDVAGAGGDAANTHVLAPTITTVTNGDTVVIVGAQRLPSGVTSNTWGDPATFGNRSQASSGHASQQNVAVVSYDRVQASAGATGTATAESLYDNGWVAFTFALRPVSGITQINTAPADLLHSSEALDIVLFDDSVGGSTDAEADPFEFLTVSADTEQSTTLILGFSDSVRVTDQPLGLLLTAPSQRGPTTADLISATRGHLDGEERGVV